MNLIKTISILLLLVLLTSFTCGCLDSVTQYVNQKTVLDLISPVIVLKGSSQYCKQFPEECKSSKPLPMITNGSPPLPMVTNTSKQLQMITNDSKPLQTIPNTYQSLPMVTNTSRPLPLITIKSTPIQTILTIPTVPPRQFDPYEAGERWQGQWFKWTWHNALGCNDINRGIIIYGHQYYSFLKQWDTSYGSYNITPADKNYKFLAVFVHEEDFGTCDTGLWGYTPDYFYIQYNGQLYPRFTNYDRVNRISELEDFKYDYYHIDLMKPFAVQRVYSNTKDATTGGYHVKELYGIRTGQGNAWDGYIIYSVPRNINDNDIRIVGKFAGQSVNWRFDMKNSTYNISSRNN